MTQPPAAPDRATAPPGALQLKQAIALVAAAAAIGLLAGIAASLFLKVEHELQHLLWHTLPDQLGQDEPAWWLVIALLVTGAVLVFGATKLPGGGGHHPLQPFALDIGWQQLPSALLAALGTLSFGAVLGPEAPLLALGTGLAALAIRRPGSPLQQVMMFTAAMAAVSAIFGNPLITAILLLEIALAAGAAMASAPVLLAALTGMACSYALQVGIQGWSGLGEAKLGLPGLTPYDTVQVIDVLVAIPLAVLIAVLAVVARLAGSRIDRAARSMPLPAIVAGAVITAVVALAAAAATDGTVDLVLFSGQQVIPEYLGFTAIGTAAVVALCKFLAYTVCLGAGFRGGAIFPAVAVGTLLAVIATLLVDGTSTSALAATAIAAATAGVMRLPFTALMLGVMLTYPAGGATTVLAAVGTVVGMLTRLAAGQRIPGLTPPRPE